MRVRTAEQDDGRAVELIIVGRTGSGLLAMAVHGRGGTVNYQPKMPPGCYFWCRDDRDDPVLAYIEPVYERQ